MSEQRGLSGDSNEFRSPILGNTVDKNFSPSVYNEYRYKPAQRIAFAILGLILLVLGVINFIVGFEMIAKNETPFFMFTTGIAVIAVGISFIVTQYKRKI